MRALDYSPLIMLKLKEDIEQLCTEMEQGKCNEELLNVIKKVLKKLFPEVRDYTFGSKILGLPFIPQNKEEYDRMIDTIKVVEKHVGVRTFFKHDTYAFYAYNEKHGTSDEFDKYADKVLQLDEGWFNDPSFYYRLTKSVYQIQLDEELERLDGKISKLEQEIKEAERIISSIQKDKERLNKERKLL